jgi:hypothetical protein
MFEGKVNINIIIFNIFSMLLIKYIFVVSHVDVELMLYDENLGKIFLA